ncbi:hypothetical protein [Caproicibacterium sp. BJN0003]|uniref:hypothetical protein n=1 Tax=Caproicibacterium sp. BJN0003 TaxID=2994078 RepID=UPI00225C015F|nr:hypothetical protein [Caproicibacterium sp. BJN0003]UZT81337.1 hypothetical protein OP489_07430 [Caproicibacterium sp. BJN0003]
MREEIIAKNLDLEKMSEDTERVQELQPLKQVSIREQMKLPEGFYKVTPDCRIVSISQPKTVQKKLDKNLHLESNQTDQAKRQTEKKEYRIPFKNDLSPAPLRQNFPIETSSKESALNEKNIPSKESTLNKKSILNLKLKRESQKQDVLEKNSVVVPNQSEEMTKELNRLRKELAQKIQENQKLKIELEFSQKLLLQLYGKNPDNH